MKDGWTEEGVAYRVREDWVRDDTGRGSAFYGPYRNVGAAKAAVTRLGKMWMAAGRTYTVQKMTGEWADA